MNKLKLIPLEERIVLDATLLYVSANAPNGGDGSLAHPFNHLQDALSLAKSLGGAQIDVAQGTYLPTSGTDRTATFNVSNNTTIVGGFNSSFTQDNASLYPTILSGNIGNQAINTDNSLNVVTINGGGAVSLNNLTVTQGYNDAAASSTTGNGAGILEMNGSSLTLMNVTVSNNESVYGNGAGVAALYDNSLNVQNSSFLNNINLSPNSGNNTILGSGVGSGVYTQGLTSVTINQSLFQNNSANNVGSAIYGGGDQQDILTNDTFNSNQNLAVYENNQNAGSVLVQANLFTNNIGTNQISALEVSAAQQASIIGNIFSNNQSVDTTPGGNNGNSNDQIILTIFNNSVLFQNNIVTNNTVIGSYHPAIYNSAFDGYKNVFTNHTTVGGSVIMSGNLFSNNTIQGTRAGGAISDAFDQNLTVTNNAFTGNVSAGGAAIQTLMNGNLLGGGSVNITNNLFAGNSSTQNGGALELDQNGVPNQYNISNNVFVNNSAAANGGAIDSNHVSNLQITNNVFANNKAGLAGGAIYDAGSGVVTITGNVLALNSAPQGQDIWLDGSEASVNMISPTNTSAVISALVNSNALLFSNEITIA